MTSPSPPELFTQRPVRSDFAQPPSYRMRRVVTIFAILLLLAVGLHWVLGGPSVLRPGEIATIKSEGPYKQRPEQPGGIDIPHQDVQVYQALDGKDGTKPPVEHLLPPPETPQPVPQSVSVVSAAPSVVPAPATTVSQVENLSSPKTQIAEAPVPAAVPAPVPVVVVPSSPLADVKPAGGVSASRSVSVAHPAKIKPLTITQVLKDNGAVSGTDRVVQLASVQDETAAQDMAEKLQTRYTSILGKARLRLVRADLGTKGTYYRVQSQPVPGNQADGICAALKKMKAGCILVRP